MPVRQEPSECFKAFLECSHKANRTHGKYYERFQSLKDVHVCAVNVNNTKGCSASEHRFLLNHFLLQLHHAMSIECYECSGPYMRPVQKNEMMTATSFPYIPDCTNAIAACEAIFKMRMPGAKTYTEVYNCVENAPNCWLFNERDEKERTLTQISHALDEDYPGFTPPSTSGESTDWSFETTTSKTPYQPWGTTYSPNSRPWYDQPRSTYYPDPEPSYVPNAWSTYPPTFRPSYDPWTSYYTSPKPWYERSTTRRSPYYTSPRPWYERSTTRRSPYYTSPRPWYERSTTRRSPYYTSPRPWYERSTTRRSPYYTSPKPWYERSTTRRSPYYTSPRPWYERSTTRRSPYYTSPRPWYERSTTWGYLGSTTYYQHSSQADSWAPGSETATPMCYEYLEGCHQQLYRTSLGCHNRLVYMECLLGSSPCQTSGDLRDKLERVHLNAGYMKDACYSCNGDGYAGTTDYPKFSSCENQFNDCSRDYASMGQSRWSANEFYKCLLKPQNCQEWEEYQRQELLYVLLRDNILDTEMSSGTSPFVKRPVVQLVAGLLTIGLWMLYPLI